jgi:hypothetical protein
VSLLVAGKGLLYLGVWRGMFHPAFNPQILGINYGK